MQAEMKAEVSQEAALVAENTAPGGEKLLTLDEMITQFSNPQTHENAAQAQMDPFSAMKATLEANQIPQTTKTEAPAPQAEIPAPQSEVPVATVATPQEASTTPEATPATNLSSPENKLNTEVPLSPAHESLGATPSLQTPNFETIKAEPTTPAETPNLAGGINLDQLTAMGTSPLSNPTLYPQTVTAQATAAKPSLKVAFLAGFAVLALSGVFFIKYQDVVMDLFAGTKPNTTITTLEPEHNAPALLTGEQLGTENEETSPEAESILPSEPIEVEGNFGEEEGAIQTIDLREEGEPTASENETSPEENQPSEALQEEKPENDALGAVEGLVGPLNNNDLLKQEIAAYQSKGQNLKEQGIAQNKKTMMKYGLAVEKSSQKLLDELANGGNIDISRWSAEKAQLDDYLAKATNA